MKSIFSGSLIAPALLVPMAPALAQATPDIQDAINSGTQIDEALRNQQRTLPQPEAAGDDIIDGEAGVYAVTINDIFYVGGSLGAGWSENPLRTVDDVGDSTFIEAAATAGVQTRLAGAVDAGFAATISGTEYRKDFAPSSRSLSASANVGTAISGTPLYAGLTAFGGFSYDDSFKNGTGFYGGYASLSAGLPLSQRALVRASVQGGRQMGDIEENNSWNVNLSGGLSYLIMPKLSAGFDLRATRTWFDDFYENVTFVERKDWEYGGNVNATYAPLNWLSVTGSVGYQKRESAFFLSEYDSWEAALIVTARKRF